MRRNAALGTLAATSIAVAAALVPALPATAATAATGKGSTVSGVVTAVSAGHSSFTLHRSGGGWLTITVSEQNLLVHGINAPVGSLTPGMTVIANGVVRNAHLTADAARAFTPAKRLSTMAGYVVDVNPSARQIVVRTAPYQTAVAFLTPGATVNGVHNTSVTSFAPGRHITLVGHADSVDSSELLASTVTCR